MINRNHFDASQMLDGLNPANEADRLLLEVGEVVRTAEEQPKNRVFDFLLRELPDSTLSSLIDGITTSDPPSEHPVFEPVILLSVFLRSTLHGDARGGFAATDAELAAIVNTLAPYFVLELVRRSGGFEEFEMPESPWSVDAAVKVATPNRTRLAEAVAELEQRGLPYPNLLNDEALLDQMETEDIGIILPLPPETVAVASGGTPAIQPHKLPPLDPKAFEAMFHDVVQRAFSNEPLDPSDTTGTKVKHLRGSELDDTPVGKTVAIIHQHFGSDKLEHQSALRRYYTVLTMLRNGRLAGWTVRTPQGDSVHPAVIHAAATMKFTKGGDFPPAQFQREVERLAKAAIQPSAN